MLGQILRIPIMRWPFLAPQLSLPILKATVIGLATTLTVSSMVLGYYVVTRKPLTAMPGIGSVAEPVPPRQVFTFAGVASPLGVAVSPDGQHIYVAEGGGQRLIKVFDRDGKQIAQTAPPNTKPGGRMPGQMAVDSDGRLYVANRLRAAIETYGPDLQFEGDWRPPALATIGGWLPNGVAVGADGRIYVAEIGQKEQSVLVLTPDGSLVDRLGKSAGISGGLSYPVVATGDQDGRLYVSDGNNGRVLMVGSSGVLPLDTGRDEPIALPRGLAIWQDKLFVADAATHRILVFALGDNPRYLYSFGNMPGDLGMAYPSAVAVDQSGRIYVAERANDRIQVWAY